PRFSAFPYTTLFRSGNVGRRVGLGQVGRVSRQDRGVVGAEDVDGDGRGGAVGARNRERVGIGRAVDELVVRRAGGVGPGAVGAGSEEYTSELESELN